jgi:tetratricopeptide (TPR) repeat protein
MLALPVLAACELEKILETEDNFTVTTPVARDTTNLNNTAAGAIGLYSQAFAGRRNRAAGLVSHVGIFTDELYSADGFKDDLDQRELLNLERTDEIVTTFNRLQRARATAVNASELFGQTSRASTPQRAELYNIAGLSVLGLAENFCSGIPLGRVTDAGFTYGQPLTTTQLYEQAIAYFDSAAAIAPANSLELNTARSGKARVLLDMGQFEQAAALAAQVPNTFAGYLVRFSPTSQETENAIFQLGTEERRFGASRSEGTVNRGLPFDDPRTPRATTALQPYDPAKRTATLPQVFPQLKYNSLGAPVPILTGYEALLIRAEAALRAGQTAQFRTLLNQARVQQAQPALPDAAFTGTQAQLVDLLFRERAYGLWLTGTRLSDLRRLIRQYGRTQDQVFPTGETMYRQPYGTDVSFPAPFDELNNPNFKGCINRDA